MSDEMDQSTLALNNAPAETVTVTVETKPAETPAKLPELDPYLMFKKIEEMRKEGVEESVIRDAFNDLMKDRAEGFRKPTPNKMKRSAAGLGPMPTQEEINKLYETSPLDDKSVLSVEVGTLMEELEKAKERKVLLAATKPPRPTLKMYFYRAMYYSLNKFLGVIVYLFNKAGIK